MQNYAKCLERGEGTSNHKKLLSQEKHNISGRVNKQDKYACELQQQLHCAVITHLPLNYHGKWRIHYVGK